MAAIDALPTDVLKDYLNIPSTQFQFDDELTRYTGAAVALAERYTERMFYPRNLVERHYAVGNYVVVNKRPLTDLVSLTQVYGAQNQLSGYVYGPDLLFWETETGMITGKPSTTYLYGLFDVAYTAGYTVGTLPADYQLALCIIAGEMWAQSQRRSLGSRPGGPTDLGIMPNTTMPPAARELLGSQSAGIGVQ